MAHTRFWLAAAIGTFSSSLLQWVGRIADSQLLYKSPIETNRPSKPRSASNKEKSFRSQLRFIIAVGPCVILDAIILYTFVGVKPNVFTFVLTFTTSIFRIWFDRLEWSVWIVVDTIAAQHHSLNGQIGFITADGNVLSFAKVVSWRTDLCLTALPLTFTNLVNFWQPSRLSSRAGRGFIVGISWNWIEPSGSGYQLRGWVK